MRLELDHEETVELLALIVDRLIERAGLSTQDRATVKRWRVQNMRPGSDGMSELTGKINADIERTLRTKEKSAVRRPDWR